MHECKPQTSKCYTWQDARREGIEFETSLMKDVPFHLQNIMGALEHALEVHTAIRYDMFSAFDDREMSSFKSPKHTFVGAGKVNLRTCLKTFS